MSQIWKMSSHMESVINTYKRLSKIPSISDARLDKSGKQITSRWSIRNIDKGNNTQYNIEYRLDENLNVTSKSQFGINISQELLSAESPQEKYKAVIYEDKTGKDNRTFLEVWSNNTLAHSINITALDIHGNVYADSEFGCLEWSPDEKLLVYVAEKKPKKSEPFIKRKAKQDDSDAEKKITPGEEHLYRKDWGEQLVGKYQSVAVICEIETEKFTILEGLPETWCPGQLRFTPNSESVIGVAWDISKYQLGLIYCTNRPSYIFCLNINNGILKKLSGDNLAVRSPRIGPQGDVIWLQRPANGPHHACHQLARIPGNTINNIEDTSEEDLINSATIVVDVVKSGLSIAGEEIFHGIYSQGLPKRCFSEDGRVVFSTQQKNEVRSYIVDLETGNMVDISNNKSQACSTSVTCLRADLLLAICSNLTTPTQLYVAKLPEPGSQVSWIKVSEADREIVSSLSGATVEYLEHSHPDSTDTISSFTSIYFGPSTKEDVPLIVWPHGGPHSAFSNVYLMEAAFFHLLGFACLLINYRGSTGAGDEAVRFLPSRIGTADVQDCHKATLDAEDKFPIDRNRHVLFGGSHGGYLVTLLSGLYPDLYKVVVTRNPVIDIPPMFNTSDIPDWCSVEAGLEYREDGPVIEEELLTMRRCSPIVHAHKVRAPTAIMLGSNDKRVPSPQGLEYGRRLRANGVATRIYMYEDNHSLSSLPAEMDNLINAADWFITMIKPTQ